MPRPTRLLTGLLTGAALILAACGGNRDTGSTADTAATAGGGAGSAGSAAGAAGGMDTTGTAAATGGSAGAAAGGASGTTAPGAGGASTSLADPSTTQQLDSVATLTRGSLTALAPSAAVPLIRTLEDKLNGANDPALTDVASDLGQLREALEGGAVDGGRVATILARLGPKVTAAAGKAGPAAGTVRTIGRQLTSAAPQLRGGGR